MIQTSHGAAAPISMDKVGRRNYADNNRGADGDVGLSASPPAAVGAAITSGAATDADTVAIADEAVASGRRPRAAAVRPRQSSRQRGLGRLLLHGNGSSGHVLLGPIVAADPVPDTVSRRGCDPGGSIGTARVQLPLKPGVLQASQRLWATLIGLVRISLIATGQRPCLKSRRPRTTSDLLLRHRSRRCRG